eukprot:s3789_g10.t1
MDENRPLVVPTLTLWIAFTPKQCEELQAGKELHPYADSLRFDLRKGPEDILEQQYVMDWSPTGFSVEARPKSFKFCKMEITCLGDMHAMESDIFIKSWTGEYRWYGALQLDECTRAYGVYSPAGDPLYLKQPLDRRIEWLEEDLAVLHRRVRRECSTLRVGSDAVDSDPRQLVARLEDDLAAERRARQLIEDELAVECRARQALEGRLNALESSMRREKKEREEAQASHEARSLQPSPVDGSHGFSAASSHWASAPAAASSAPRVNMAAKLPALPIQECQYQHTHRSSSANGSVCQPGHSCATAFAEIYGCCFESGIYH